MTKVIALQKSFPDMLSLTDLEMAITRPYDDARVDDAGDWEEICSNVREFSKLYLDHDYDDNSILSRRILLNGLDDNNCIIVDDGSTDDSRKICQKYANKYSYISLYCKSNGGVASARNMALEHASGEYFYWIDPDDYDEF